jgi:5-methylthioadenosine/S-adenosylhomocysteine deaminase
VSIDASSENNQRPCDLLIRNGYVITLDAERRVFADGAVAVDAGTIIAVGRDEDVASAFEPRQALNARGAPVHPGFFDCHAHVTLHTTRGAFPDSPSEAEYMSYYTRWMNALEPEDEYASALLAYLEMLRNGITCFLEPGTAFEPDAAVEAAHRIGIRGSVTDPYIWDIESSPSIHELTRAPVGRRRALGLLGQQLHRNSHPEALVRGHVNVYGAASASDELEREAKACADDAGVVLTQHQNFDPEDVRSDDSRWGKHALAHLHDIGCLGPNCVFAHMNFVRNDEVAPLVDSGTAIAWNPGNYLNYGIGSVVRTRVPELYRLGVPVGPGSDVAKVWGFGEQGWLGYLLAREKEDYLSPEQVLEMTTISAARALGLDDRLGSLEPGKRADVVIRTADVTEAHPALDMIRNLVLVERTKSVDTVLVDGQVVVRNGRAVLLENEEVYALAERSARTVAGRLELSPGTVWPVIA